MRQVLQSLQGRGTEVRAVPAPHCGPREILIANAASLISAGTEKSIVDVANSSLLTKARRRPDDVRRVMQSVVREGLMDTFRQVRARLAEPLALGYSSAGIVLEVGREVARFHPGDRVASNGAHAEIVAVPHTLAARVPDGVPLSDACYAAVAAVALQGVRLASTGIGDRVAIIGLGLIGQIAVHVCRAAGNHVLGTDLDPSRVSLAALAGSDVAAPDAFAALVEQATSGHGADAVVITASGSDSSALQLAAAVARKKARIVVVGAVGLEVPRREFYAKELALVVSCSYGPGRYDREYEEKGIDYPYAYVRWTEQRNLEAVLELMARGSLDVHRLTTHTFRIDEATRAYELMERAAEPHLGIVLTYDATVDAATNISLPETRSRQPSGRAIGIGLVGSGRYSAAVLAPALRRIAGTRLRAICSAGGIHATALGEQHGFERATTSFDELVADPHVNAVVLATPHHLHCEQAQAALRAGKHVFIEKPLATSADELAAFEAEVRAIGDAAPLWTVGFNRRFSKAAGMVRDFFAGVGGPLTLSYRFNAGSLPSSHWAHDPEIGGGRLIGEACHALDLSAFLLDAQIVRVFAEAPAVGASGGSGDDQAAITVRCSNGAVASIGYFSGGNKTLPKERIEVFGGGRVAIIDDFASVTFATDGRTKRRRLLTRDKGHAAELIAFVEAVAGGGPPPIPYASLLNVSWAALHTVESIKSGLPVNVRVF